MLNNKNYYPTPDSLIRQMILKAKDIYHFKYILEPSAGSGNILDFYKKYYKSNCMSYNRNGEVDDILNIECIENDQTLYNTLQGKGYNVVWDDFLTFEPSRFYDLIIMNPPFDNGCDHLLKAIEIQERIGGKIVCILNAETLKNDYSQNRKYLNTLLSQYNADIEYIENAFRNGERKTDVEIALIYINIPMKNTKTLFEKELKMSKNIEFNINDMNSVTKGMTKVEKLILEYNTIKNSSIKLFEEQLRISKLIKAFGMDDQIFISYGSSYSPKVKTVNEFIDDLNLKYWNKFIDETEFKSKLPSKLRSDFSYNIDRQKNIEFSLSNIQYFTEQLLKGIPKAYEETVAEIFDRLTLKHCYTGTSFDKNIHYFNGWKTNKAFKIVGKVIIPVGYWSFGMPEVLRDLNLVFENMSGKKDDINQDEYLKNGIKEFGKKLETEFFIIDSFKKGTLHISFKDKELLDKFNILANKGKNALPMDFGDKKYSDMTQEEKTVCSNFGMNEEEYMSICGKMDFLRLG